MNDAFDTGKLALRLICRDGAVAATDIRSTRPQAARVLQGKTPEQVATLVPLLYSVCRREQGAAAQAALQAAAPGVDMEPARERAIACEALQEHLWRLLLDWPKLLDLPPQEQQFAAWHALLQQVAGDAAAMDHFLREFERAALGMAAEQWRALAGYADLQAWLERGATPLARMLARLTQQESGRKAAGKACLLPAWSAQDAQHACAGQWTAAFAAQPEWQGVPAETGAWSYHADMPLLQDVLQQTGSRALVRVLAKVLDIVALATGRAAPRLDAASAGPGEGVATARTARGLLLHHVRLDAGRVASCTICAPTEWNFHPAGAFAQALRDVRATDAEELQRTAQIEALSLDPCVAYEVVTQNA